MGGVLSCCRDESSSTAAAVALNSVGTKNEKQNDHGNNGNNGNGDNDDNPYDENDDEIGSDIFFSARESFSQLVNELSYPPTSTPKSGRTSNITIDHPETLLLLHDHDCAVINEEEEGNSSRVKRPTVILKEQLTSSSFGSDGTTTMKAGYPGELSQDELDACIEFRNRLRDPISDPTYRCMVYLNVDIDVNANNQEDATGSSVLTVDGKGPEEEAFALCRFLRARQFNVNDTFTMMEEHIDLFKTCLEANNLWRSLKQVEIHTNCPLFLFWNQFPMIDYGIAKNGSYVVYMKAGLIRLHDGFDCINPIGTPTEFVDQYLPIAWWLLCYKFCDIMNTKQQEQKQQSQQDNNTDYVVLAEAVIIVDLAGLQRSFFTARTMEFLKCVFNVIQCFPEILNRVVVVNTPYFFTFIWTVLKHFVDPRTVKKIGFFSSISSAKNDLLQLIDSNQLLNEYGGTNDDNMTYDDVLTNQMYRDNTNGSRFIIERYATTTTSSNTNSDKQKKKSSLNTFELDGNETAILTVYTQAKVHVDVNVEEGNNITTTGTKFLLLSSSSLDNDDSDVGAGAGDKVSVAVAGRAAATTTTTTMTAITKTVIDNTENKNSNGNDEDDLQFGQPAATTIENSIVHGPGTYQLVAAAAAIIEGGGVGGEKEQYLLVVSIANK